MTYCHLLEVCFDILLKTSYEGSVVRWEFSNCHMNVSEWYEDNKPKKYIHKCCAQPGNYTLICHNLKKPTGWKGGYIEFLGHRHCDDFMGFKAIRGIRIEKISESTCLQFLF